MNKNVVENIDLCVLWTHLTPKLTQEEDSWCIRLIKNWKKSTFDSMKMKYELCSNWKKVKDPV